MSDVSQGPGWWQASDGKWYAPDLHPDFQASAPADQSAGSSSAVGSDQVFATAGSAPAFATPDNVPVFPAIGSAAPAFPAVGSDPDFSAADQSQSVAYPGIQYPDVRTSHDKSKTTAGLLAIFLGALGIHRFYMGYKVIGAIMLIITVASLGRLALITVPWGLVEGILIFTGKMKKDKYGGVLT
jgi:TM2 domain-containing membrane protein YozV